MAHLWSGWDRICIRYLCFVDLESRRSARFKRTAYCETWQPGLQYVGGQAFLYSGRMRRCVRIAWRLFDRSAWTSTSDVLEHHRIRARYQWDRACNIRFPALDFPMRRVRGCFYRFRFHACVAGRTVQRARRAGRGHRLFAGVRLDGRVAGEWRLLSRRHLECSIADDSRWTCGLAVHASHRPYSRSEEHTSEL